MSKKTFPASSRPSYGNLLGLLPALATLAAEIESFRSAGVTNLAAVYMKDAPGAVLGGSSVVAVGSSINGSESTSSRR